ncbi:Beige 1 [Vanrija pseudolonga]|uniref:Beige 1 n=1 Tax=Vanrija pseudolonga TaxID=143232 RepID=A0AAF0YGX9_9TREE|nr:Beige 1 [Vanrija pseudolonga]
MFKLIKDLTRPPEPLNPTSSSASASATASGSSAPPPPWAPRSRAASSASASGLPANLASPGSSATAHAREGSMSSALDDDHEDESTEDDNDDEDEDDPDAIRVIGLLYALMGVTDTMGYVETLSELLSVPSTPASRRAFRRNAGFVRLRHALAFGLTWRPQKEGEDEQAYQVDEVQRSEGQRLALETLSWATGDRENQAFFEEHGGYSALLRTLWQLSPPVDAQADGTSARHTPDVRILGLLLAHILNNNYSLLSIFGSPESIDSVLKSEDALTSKLGEVTISKPAALPLLWSYLWGLSDAEPVSPKGKERETGEEDVLFAGGFEPTSGLKPKLVLLVIQIFRLAAVSAAGLFQLKNYLPSLADFLLTRLYGWAPERKFAVTFPAREEWYQNASAEDAPPKPTWTPAEEPLRAAYLALLKRLLEAGTSPEQTWRLFQLVRKVPPRPKPLTPIQEGNEDSGAGTPNAAQSPPPSASSAKSLRGKANLKLVVPPSPQGEETLDLEVLEVIHKAMHARTPDVFVFRGGQGIADGGIETSDIGRNWPSSTKGFIFTSWIYITKLNDAVTILHLSQKGEQHPLFRIRILENSQVGLTSTAYVDETTEVPEEVVCQAPEALVPHHEWVHFAVGCRKGRSANGGGGEARIFVNGKRVGAVRIPYPMPSAKSRPHAAHKHGPNYERHAHHRHAAQGQGVRVSIGRPWLNKDNNNLSESFLMGGGGLGKEDNQWMLGRALLLEDVLTEDLVLLMHHLGPRYYGNYQEALGKFLTYKGATSVNLYLHGLAQAASQQKTIPLLPSNSALVRAIRSGPSIAEENIMLSLCSKDALTGEDGAPGSFVLNGAVTHAFFARDVRYGRAKMVDHVFPFATTSMDEAVSTVGGGVVVLKLIDLAEDSEQLATTLTILQDMVRDSWSASEEMERIHGFELLAAILRPKMATIVDLPVARILLGILGVNPDKPQAAVVHNSAAYRAIGLDFELWATAKDDVVSLYFENFSALLSVSKYKRYNLLRTFQKSNMVRKLLYAIRLGLYNTTTLPLAVDTLKLALTSRWSAEEGIKPVFSYLVSALCQNVAPAYLIPTAEPTAAQLPAALILQMMAELLTAPKRLTKLNKAVSLHRLIVVLLQSNPAPFVAIPCLDILKLCLSTPGLESFQRSFETEGGFALLARTLAPIWQDHIQETVFAIVLGKDGMQGSALACPPAIASLTTALETLLQTANEAADGARSSTLGKSVGSVRSLAATPLAAANEGTDYLDVEDDNRLEKLLYNLAAVYRTSKPFRKALSMRRIEAMLPSFVDFAAMSASSSRSQRAENQRVAAACWLSELISLSKAPPNVMTQMKLLVEQLKSTSGEDLPPISSSSRTPVPTPPISRTPSYRASASSRLASSPGAAPASPIRQRPSADARPGVVRRASAADKKMPQLRRVLTGESILQEEQDKNTAWRMIILSTDSQRFATMTLDRKEHWHRLSQVEWPQLVATLRSENGVWADEEDNVQWRLDGSEGPLRMRSRLERISPLSHHSRSRARTKLRDAIPAPDELSSAVSRVNAAPWEDPFALALGEAAPIAEHAEEENAGTPTKATTPAPEADGSDDEGSFVDIDDESPDKMRLVAKALEAGDVVEEAHNIVRIVGVDALPGLLILGKRNLYLIDGLVQTADCQIVEADQAPRDVLSIPSGTLADLDPTDQRSHRWPYSDVVETNKRAFLFRDVALELYFSDKQNFLVVFKDKRQRQAVVSRLSSKVEKGDVLSRSILGSLVLDTVARAIDNRGYELENLTRRWQSREISNFAYLQMLNQYANRTPNDVTQYPVFPWVLADYTSQSLDFSKASTFRDLSLPMGALTPARRDAAVERYQATEGVGETPFHYGTHYSSSMIVCGYMIRESPFTDIFLALQGGTFDLADRLFSSIPKAWDSASSANRGDVRELIPEFFYAAAFLINMNHHDFGKKQVSGDTVDDVALPPWALNDPLLFVHWNREALESDFVSRHLPEWIDLTFGCKQRDPSSFNCFHPLSYRGAVNLDKITDEAEKAASTAIIHNFGQTPVQIFKYPHPQKFLGGRTTLPVGTRFGISEHWQLLLRSILPIIESPRKIHYILDPSVPDGKPGVQPEHRLAVPGNSLLSLQYGFIDQSLRIYYMEHSPKLLHIVEGIEVTHARFVSPTLLITVSPLGVLTAWRLAIKGSGHRRGDISLQREATLRGNEGSVTCVAKSTAWSLLVTGANDGSAMVWDTNRLRYTRTLKTPRREPIKFAAVSGANGHIALASDRYLYIFSLNGHPIASTSIDGGRFALNAEGADDSSEDKFTGGIAFLKKEFLKGGELFVVGVGTQLDLYRLAPGVRRFEDQEVEPWRLVKQGTLFRSDEHDAGDVTAVRFIGDTLYAAFEAPAGHKYPLYQWSLPDCNARNVPESVASFCMAEGCTRHFGLLEPRRHCGGCGGAFCGSHAVHVEGFNARYCDTCKTVLSYASALGLLQSRLASHAGSRQTSRQTSRRPSVSGNAAESASPSRSQTQSPATPTRTAGRPRSDSRVWALLSGQSSGGGENSSS